MRGAVHEYTIEHRNSASALVDAEGRVQPAEAPRSTVVGIVSSAGRANRADAFKVGGEPMQRWDVVAHAPLDTICEAGDRLIIAVPAKLAGTYDVGEVGFSTDRLRLFGSRVQR